MTEERIYELADELHELSKTNTPILLYFDKQTSVKVLPNGITCSEDYELICDVLEDTPNPYGDDFIKGEEMFVAMEDIDHYEVLG
jgi:hypothetical protein